MSRVAIIGGAGFIGSHIAENMLHNDFDVKVIDNLFTGDMGNLSEIKNKIDFVKGDIVDFKLLKKELKDIDYVFLLAAHRAVRQSLVEPKEYNQVNINGVVNVIEASMKNDVKRIIFASSSSVYGNVKKFPQKESLLISPLSPYAITKIAGEYYFKAYYELYGLQSISFRYFNVFGPRQNATSKYGAVIPIFINKLKKNESPVIFGSGEQSRDFTFVKDVARANFLGIKASKSACGKSYNIAPGNSTSILYIANKMKEIMNKNAPIIFEAAKSVDILKSQADTTLAEKELGFKCEYTFDKGLEETIDWFCR